ncbi:MAG: hypothetical protein M0004_07835 [Actinomycetota bacterium]|nr:hypothetical protein [Actinomycetota bacterium]
MPGGVPLFHAALPEALALDGLSGLVTLAEVTVAVDVVAWRRAVASHWQ